MNFEDFVFDKFVENKSGFDSYESYLQELSPESWFRLAELWGAALSKEVRAIVEHECENKLTK